MCGGWGLCVEGGGAQQVHCLALNNQYHLHITDHCMNVTEKSSLTIQQIQLVIVMNVSFQYLCYYVTINGHKCQSVKYLSTIKAAQLSGFNCDFVIFLKSGKIIHT
jgi:hypothetical protein